MTEEAIREVLERYITAEQMLRSQWLDYQGGISRVKALFGSLGRECLETCLRKSPTIANLWKVFSREVLFCVDNVR